MKISPTPGQCAAIALLTSLALMAISPSLPATALAGIVGWLGAFAGDRFKDWFKDLLNSKVKKAPPNAEAVFRNHHIRDLLQRALVYAVEKTIPAAKEQFGDVPRAFHHAGQLLAKRLAEQTDHPSGALAKLQDFNVTALLNDFVKNEGKIQVLAPETWAAFIDETPGLSDFKDPSDGQRRMQREALIKGLHQHFGEALWGIVKLDATGNGPGHAAVELLYLARILEAVEKDKSATPAAIDLTPITQRVQELLPQVKEEFRPWFEDILGGIEGLQQTLNDFRTETKQSLATVNQTTSETNENTRLLLNQIAEQKAISADMRQMLQTLMRGGNEQKLVDDYQTALRIVAAKHNREPEYVHGLMIEDAERIIGDPNISLQDKVKALREAGKFIEALDFALEAAARLERVRQKATRDEIDMLIEATRSEIQLGHYEQARLYATKAESLTDRQQDFALWRVARHGVGQALVHLRRDGEAYDLFTELTDLLTLHLGAEHPHTLSSRMELAIVLQAQGKYARAEKELRAVLAVKEGEQNMERSNFLTLRNNLATTLQLRGKYAEAEKELREVLAIREQEQGPDHPSTLANRNNLATVLIGQGRPEQAEAELRIVLEFRERVQGKEHPDTLQSRNNLASALLSQDKHAEAVRELRAMLPIAEDVLGKEHPATLSYRNNLGDALIGQGSHAEAEVELRSVITIRQRLLGREHPETLNSWNNLANAIAHQDRETEAESEYQAVLAIRQRVLGKEHPHTAQSCFNLAWCLFKQGKLNKARDFAEKAKAGRRKALGAKHPDTREAKELLDCINISMSIAKR